MTFANGFSPSMKMILLPATTHRTNPTFFGRGRISSFQRSNPAMTRRSSSSSIVPPFGMMFHRDDTATLLLAKKKTNDDDDEDNIDDNDNKKGNKKDSRKKKKDDVNARDDQNELDLYDEDDEEYEEEDYLEEINGEEEYYEEEVNGEDYIEEEEEEEEEEEVTEGWVADEKFLREFVREMDEAKAELDDIDPEELLEELTEDEQKVLEESDDLERLAEETASDSIITDEDIANITQKDIDDALAEPDDPDPFPEDNSIVYPPNVFQRDLIQLDQAYAQFQQAYVDINKNDCEMIKNVDMLDDDYILHNVLDQTTRQEILNLDVEVDLDEEGFYDEVKLHQQRKRLIYDLDYNVTNLFLSSFKANPDAPVVLDHWFPQLRNWTRYEYVRKRDFNFTWDEVDAADEMELERYWNGIGMGMDGIPKPTPRDNPNMVEWDESPLTFEEENLLAFEQWMDDVYCDEDDVNLDDEDFMPEDNPASPGHHIKDDDAVDPILKDVQEFEEKYEHMTEEWRAKYVQRQEYKLEGSNNYDDNDNDDDNNNKAFRGHVVIACSTSDDDLTMAEKLTVRMEKEFGPKVFVETRVIGHARPEDYVYEIWLESWEITLLHSKRRAVFHRDWDGPRDISDKYIEDLVKQVDFLIGDDAKYSYVMDD